MRPFSVFILACAALLCSQCATAQKPVYAEQKAELSTPQWPTQVDDVSTAFEAPQPEVANALPPQKGEVFEVALRDARLQLKRKGLADARGTSASLRDQASQLGGAAFAQAAAFHFDVLKAEKQWAEAGNWAWEWHHQCGPERIEPCRFDAARALASVSGAAAVDKMLKKNAGLLFKTEQCLRSTTPTPECTATAQRFAEQEHDTVTSLRLLLQRAAHEDSEAAEEGALRRAEASCHIPVCGELRRRALRRLSQLALNRANIELALGYAFKETEVFLQSAPEDQRTWARPETLDSVCEAYESKNGAGTCRSIEKKRLGTYVFHDFSKRQVGDGLGPEEVRRVGAHYAPLLQNCLMTHARTLKSGEQEKYGVRWTVQNDGRVGDVHLTRKDLDATELAQCMRTQFALWRYPKFRGEWQNVEQVFSVSTAANRDSRSRTP